MLPIHKMLKKLGPWFYSFLISVVLSFALYSIMTPIVKYSHAIFLASVIISFLFWLFLGLVGMIIRFRPARIAFSILMSVFTASLFAASLFLSRAFGTFLSVDMLRFILNEPGYLNNYFKTYLLNVHGIAFFGFIAALFYFWYRPKWHKPISLSKRTILAMIIILILVIGGISKISSYSSSKFMTIDTSFLIAVERYLMEQVKFETLHASSTRLKVNPSGLSSPYNILLVLNEGAGPYGISAFGYDGEAMPFFSQWFEKEKSNFFVFKKFYSNSGYTQVSIPSMMTGVEPFEDIKKFHSMPLIWDWARAAGYSTFLVSSQRYSYAAMDTFLLDFGPDYYATTMQMDLPIVHDLGVDDLGAVEYLKKAFENVPKGKPFVSVYNSNALHEPFQAISKYVTIPPHITERYKKGMYILDKTIERIYIILEELGFLDTTIIIFTADHATHPIKHGMPRVFSYYSDVLCIPFMIRMPSTWIKNNPELVKNIQANEDRLGSNIDIIPTIVTLLGLEDNNKEITTQLSGRSLCRPLPPRSIIILNSNDASVRSDQEGFGIYWEDRSFIFSETQGQGPTYYDMTIDPDQTRNFWEEADVKEKEKVLMIINSNRHLKRIFNKRH